MLVFIFEFFLPAYEISNFKFGRRHLYLVECTISENHLAFGNYRVSEIILKELVMIINGLPGPAPPPIF